MAVDIGPKIGIEGEAQYRRELNQIVQGQKTLAAEAKAVSAAMQDETDAEKKAAAEKDVLNRQIATQREKLAKLEEGLTASARKYGEADTRTMKWQQAVYNATGELANMEHKLRSSDGQVEEITQDMGEAEKATSGWGDVMKGTLAADVVKKGLAFIKEAVSGIAEKTLEASKAGAAYADDFLTLATNTGVATDTLQELAYMEGIADVSTGDVAKAIQKLKKTMATAEDQNQSYAKKMAQAAQETDAQKRAQKEASIELGSTAAAYAELGVAVKDANGNFRKGEDVFFDMIAALGKVEDETKRDTMAMTLMGKSATDLNPIITAGADALAQMRQEAHDTGYVLSGSALSALGKQQDAMDRLDKKTEALSNRFASKLAPSMEKAYSLMGDALDNPRVKRGLDVVAEGIGSLISGASELAAKVLPGLFSIFDLGDARLKYLTDDQLALVASVDESKQAHEEMISAYKENAQAIIAETERTEGLWKELQTLVGENGEVKKADEERVNYITSELKEALGVQMQLENGILQGYKDQQKEIDNLIKKREAEALLATGAEEFAEAERKRNEALETAAKLAPGVETAYYKLAAAQREYGRQVEYAERHKDDAGAGVRRKAIEEAAAAVEKAKKAYEEINKQYQTASENAQVYYANVEKWQRAQTAAANGNYAEVVRILAGEFGVTLDYYRQKKQLNEQEKKDLKAKISDMELTIQEYKRNLEAGLAGFSEAGLKEMESYVQEARDILDGKELAGHYIDGLIAGLTAPGKLRAVRTAAKAPAQAIIGGTKETLSIASPSKVADWMGEMWDAGLVRGILRDRKAVEAASRIVAGAFVGPAAAAMPTASYSGGTTLMPLSSGAGGGTSSSSVRIGTIPINITTQGPVDARALAAEISVQLSDTLRQAQRGGRK